MHALTCRSKLQEHHDDMQGPVPTAGREDGKVWRGGQAAPGLQYGSRAGLWLWWLYLSAVLRCHFRGRGRRWLHLLTTMQYKQGLAAG